jgi:purine nucleosidase
MLTKVILDTDIGSDIDDAVCLAYLLSQPDCELLGITTVSGEPVKRAMMASAMCKIADKKVPIYPGAEKPLLANQRQPLASQARALDRWEHDKDFPQFEAVEFLRKTIRKYPEEVVLLPIGPMTNIALLFSIDPEIPKLLKGIVLMSGFYEKMGPSQSPMEWNVMCDPHAAAIVYNAPVKIHRSIGLDVTLQVTMEKEEVRRNFKADILKPVIDFAEVWFEHTPVLTFHDPLAATTIFDEEICSFERGKVDIEIVKDDLKGATYWKQDDENGVHEVALKVNRDRFFEHYFSVVNK